jgi:hypothetical protein
MPFTALTFWIYPFSLAANARSSPLTTAKNHTHAMSRCVRSFILLFTPALGIVAVCSLTCVVHIILFRAVGLHQQVQGPKRIVLSHWQLPPLGDVLYEKGLKILTWQWKF